MIKLLRTRAAIKVLALHASPDALWFQDVSTNYMTSVEISDDYLVIDCPLFNFVNSKSSNLIDSYSQFVVKNVNGLLPVYNASYSTVLSPDPSLVSTGFWASGGTLNGSISSISYVTDTITSESEHIGTAANEGTLATKTDGYFTTALSNVVSYIGKLNFANSTMTTLSGPPVYGAATLMNKGWIGYWCGGSPNNNPSVSRSDDPNQLVLRMNMPVNTVYSMVFLIETIVTTSATLSSVTQGASGLYSPTNGYVVGGQYISYNGNSSNAYTNAPNIYQLNFATLTASYIGTTSLSQFYSGAISNDSYGYVVGGFSLNQTYHSNVNSYSYGFSVLSALHTFNFSNNSWLNQGSMPNSSFQGGHGNSTQGYVNSGNAGAGEINKIKYNGSGYYASTATISSTLGYNLGMAGLCRDPLSTVGTFNPSAYADGTGVKLFAYRGYFIGGSVTLPSHNDGVDGYSANYGTTSVIGLDFYTLTGIVGANVLASSCVSSIGLQSSTTGFVCGGVFSTSNFPVNRVISHDLRTETFVTDGYILTTGVQHATGLNSSTTGYICGGSTSNESINPSGQLNSIQTLNYSTLGTSTLSATLNTSREDATGLNSSTTGYICGGYTQSVFGLNTLENLTFFTNTTSTMSATLSLSRLYGVGLNSGTTGYICGGFNQSLNITNVDNLNFHTNTISANSTSLTLAQYAGSGVQTTDTGYICGQTRDYTGSGPVNVLNSLNFSTNTCGTAAITNLKVLFGSASYSNQNQDLSTVYSTESEYTGYSVANIKWLLLAQNLNSENPEYNGYQFPNVDANYYYIAPNRFAFNDSVNNVYGGVATSSAVTISGLSEPLLVKVYVETFDYAGNLIQGWITSTPIYASIHINGSNMGTSAVVSNGQTLQISLQCLGSAANSPIDNGTATGGTTAYVVFVPNVSFNTINTNPSPYANYTAYLPGLTLTYQGSFTAYGKYGGSNTVSTYNTTNASPGSLYIGATLTGDGYWPITVYAYGYGVYFTDVNGNTLAGGTYTSGEAHIILQPGQTIYAAGTAIDTSNAVNTVSIVAGSLNGNSLSQYDFTITTFAIVDTPSAFTFTNLANIVDCAVTKTGTITLVGMNTTNTISVSGDPSANLIINGANVGTSAIVGTGSTVQLQLTASCSNNTAESATVTIGTYSTTWTITTYNPTPAAFSFTGQSGLYPGTLAASNTVTISGMPTGSSNTFSVTNAYLYIDDVYVGSSGTVTNGSQVQLQMYASYSWYTGTSAYVSVGTFNTAWSIGTMVDPYLAVAQASFSSYPTCFTSGKLAFGTGDFTCSFTITPTGTSFGTSGLVSTGISSSPGIMSFTGSANGAAFGIGDSGGNHGGQIVYYFTKNVTQSVVFQRSGGTVYLYVDGGLVGSYANSINITTTSACVGGRYGSGIYPITGAVITNFSITSP